MQNNLEWCKKKLVKFLYSILSRLGVIKKGSPFRRIPPPPRLDRVNKLNKSIVDSCSKPVFLLLISRLPEGVRLKYRHPRKVQTQGND